MQATTNISDAYFKHLQQLMPDVEPVTIREIVADLLSLHRTTTTLSLKPKPKAKSSSKARKDLTDEELRENEETGRSASGWNFFVKFVSKRLMTTKPRELWDLQIMPTARTELTATVKPLIEMFGSEFWGKPMTLGELIAAAHDHGIVSNLKLSSLLWHVLSDEERVRVRQ
jgi:hypothetical protein